MTTTVAGPVGPRRVWAQETLLVAAPAESSEFSESPESPGSPDGVGGEVLGRDAAETLAFVVGQHAAEEAAAVRKLRAVMHFADLHRVQDWWAGAVSPQFREEIVDEGLDAAEAAVAADRVRVGDPSGEDTGDGAGGVPGGEGRLRLAGEGTFMVAEFAVSEVAAVLGMSEQAARRYVGEAVELRDRLPRLWAQVLAGRVPCWRARLVARETIRLSAEAAATVDAALAPLAGRISPWRVARAVEAAVLRHDPALAARQAREAAECRGVWVEDGLAGISRVHAVGNTPDVAAFDAAVDAVATTLGAWGDTDPRQARRAKALGVLADPQYALDLLTAPDPADTDTNTGAGAGLLGRRGSPAAPRQGSLRRPVIHVHLHLAAVAGTTTPPTGPLTGPLIGPVARVERYGPRAAEAVERWLADLPPGAVVKVTPVVDLTEHIAVDAHEIPDRIRAQVEERDPCCVFPWCGATGRFDLDHIIPYVPVQRGGPPGQTTAAGLARLCRYHHRARTHPGHHGRWHYHRLRDGALLWTSPLGRRYRVDRTGTQSLPDPKLNTGPDPSQVPGPPG